MPPDTASPASRPFRAGLIGCGRMAQYHLHAFRALRLAGAVDLVALADPSEEALARAGDLADVPPARRYRSYEEMLARESLDLVDVATQAPVHAPATIAAAEAGARAILCEKPIALELREADGMVAACDARGAVLAINHTLRQTPAAARALQLLREGAIGEPLSLHLWDKGGRPAGVALMEMDTHVFDLTRYLAGDAESVSATLWMVNGDGAPRTATGADIKPSQVAWPPDRDCGLVLGERCAATFQFRPHPETGARGIPAFFEAHFQPASKRWRTGIEVFGTDGSLALSNTGGGSTLDLFIARGPWDLPNRYEPVLTGEAAQHPLPEGFQHPEDAMGESFIRQIVFTLTEAVHAAEERRPHLSSGRDGLAALEMIMGVYESHAHKGARVPLPLQDRTHPLSRWPAADPPRPGASPLLAGEGQGVRSVHP